MADIYNESSGSLISGTSDSDSIQNTGSQVTIDALEGDDTIQNGIVDEPIFGGDSVSIDAGAGDDNIYNNGANVTINADDGDDNISNEGNNVTINAGIDNDRIYNNGANVYINASDGNDYISTDYNSNVTIDAGAGDDSIFNDVTYVSINGGEGDDKIYNESFYVTIDGGTGDDSIRNSGAENVLFQYAGGDGNDYITGFNATSTLSISGGENAYAYRIGSDIIVALGDSSITLEGAADLEDVNIIGAEFDIDSDADSDTDTDTDTDSDSDYIKNSKNNTVVNGTSGNDSISNSGNNVTINALGGNDTINNSDMDGYGSFLDGISSSVSIDAGAGNDSIKNNGETVTINGGAGNDDIYNFGDNVTINAGAGNDLIDNSGENVTIDAGAGNDYIDNYGETVTINGGAGNDKIGSRNDFAIIDGGTGDDSIENTGDNISISGGEDNDSIKNWGNGNNVMIDGGAGDDYIQNDGYLNSYHSSGENVSIDGGTGNDTISLINTPENNLIVYNAGDGNDLIQGFNETSTLSISGSDNAFAFKSGSNIIVAVGDDLITLEGAASLGNANIIGAELFNNTKDNVVINGTDDDDDISNSGANVTINALGGNDFIIKNDGENVILNGGEGDDEIENRGEFTTLNGDAGNDTISNWEAGNVILNGGDGDDDMRNTGSNVTINAGKGNDSIYNEGNNILFNYTAGDGNYLIQGFNETSTLSISGGENISEVRSGSDIIIAVDDSSITLEGAASLGNVNVIGAEFVDINGTDSGDYIYNRDDNLAINGGEGNDTVYNSGSNVTIDAGAGNDTVYNNGSNVTIDAGADNDSLQNEGSNVTITGGAGNDTIDNTWGSNVLFQYSEGDGNDYIQGFKENSTLSILGSDNASAFKSGSDIIVAVGNSSIILAGAPGLGRANIIGAELVYDSSYGSDIYSDSDLLWKRDGNKVTFSLEDSEKILLELDGIEQGSSLTLEDKTLKLSEDNFIEEGVSVLSNAGNFGFEIADGDYSYGKFTASDTKDVITNNGRDLSIFGRGGKDSIVNNANNVTIDGGAGGDKIINTGANVEISGGKGNDIISLSGGEQAGNIFVYSSGDGKDVIYNFTENDSIKIADNSSVEANVVGNDIEFKVGTGSITIRDGAKDEVEVAFLDSVGNDIESLSGNKYTTDGVISNDEDGEPGILLAPDFKGTYTANAVSKVNGSQTKKGIAIDGGTEGISFIGGKGKDTLTSGENIFEMTGGKGNDIFVYNGGQGVITDYGNGKDKISLGDSLSVTEYEIANKNVVLSFGDRNRLTLESGLDKTITFGTKNSTVNVYTEEGIFDGNEKSVKLLSTLKEFSAAKNSKLISIDGSAAEEEIAITGNSKKNYIVAGENGGSLDGGKGKDTLVGGDGEDVFIYDSKSGNKTIINYSNEQGDKISLGSGASISEVQTKSKDIVLKVGNNKITLKDAGNNPFTFEEGGATKTFSAGLLVSADKESVSLTSAASKTIDLSSEAYDDLKYKNVSAELLKKAVTITGDVEDNKLTGGKGKDSISGGDGDDTLNGGKGNDTLWGGSGNDTFMFNAGGGTDMIMDYEQGDMLKILDKNNRDVAFSSTFDDDTFKLSVKGGGKVLLSGVASSTSININDATKTVSEWVTK